MSIKREDLQAAAASGIVQYTQIDPLLIFLSQRDVNRQREAMLKEQHPRRGGGWQRLVHMVTLLFIGALTALAAIYSKLTLQTLGTEDLLWFIGLYTLFTMAVAAWFERRRIAGWIRVFMTSLIALLPLAMFATQQLKL
jgi:hypothetical protein